MITPELITYLKTELAKGKSRGDLQKELFLQGGWKAVDVDEAFKAADGVTVAPVQQTPRVHKKVRLLYVIILMALAAYAGWWVRDRQQFLKIPFLNKATVVKPTSQVTFINDQAQPNTVDRKIPGQGELVGWRVTQGMDNQVLYKEEWSVMREQDGYTFTLPSGNFINWKYSGQTCTEDMSSFSYGTSTSVCIKGWMAWMGLKDARSSNTQEDLNYLGDFAVKNQ